jgi:hypothetical protein
MNSAQDRYDVGGDRVPVEVVRLRSVVEEDEARGVSRPRMAVEVLRVERTTESVGTQNVEAAVAHERGHGCHRVKHPLRGRSQLRAHSPSAR